MSQAMFYNLTGQDLTLTVNNQSGNSETITALPTTSPFTPNHNANTWTRYNTNQPQNLQFGDQNTVHYDIDQGAGGSLTVQINIPKPNQYPTNYPLLIFLYLTAVVVVCTNDSYPYMGQGDGAVITVEQSSDSLM